MVVPKMETAIMESLEPYLQDEQEVRFLPGEKLCNQMVGSAHSKTSLPDVLSNELTSLNLHGGSEDKKSFLLIDSEERLTIESENLFAQMLGCDINTSVKVVSILGNTGEGKSYTLNQAFFQGEEVFPTSPDQESCTTGVWCSYEPGLQALFIDTEGMLGSTTNQNIRTRMLLKVLAVSDVVIYRTRAERLHNDLFYFLGDASKSYSKHFSAELNRINQDMDRSSSQSPEEESDNITSMGPAILLFHETIHTDPLGGGGGGAGVDPHIILRKRLAGMQQDISAFCKLCYLGLRKGEGELEKQSQHGYTLLRESIVKELRDNTVRSPRNISLVHKAFSALNGRFSGSLSPTHRSFPDQYFTCQSACQSCSARCKKENKHVGEHAAQPEASCTYSAILENKVYSCKSCKENGRKNLVVPKASSSKEGSWVGLAKFAWSGFVLECSRCGVIYRSREQWFGNLDPETQGVVHTSLAHVWPGVRSLQGTQNAARRLLDGVSALSGSVSQVSGAPAVSLARWAADQVAPSYWRPNADITNCHSCCTRFTVTNSIHHCRACGEGFCQTCSNFQRPVPEKGWGFQPVRVCKVCYLMGCEESSAVQQSQPKEVQVRKVGESVIETVASLANTLEIPISLIKDSARPDYWVPDHEINSCNVCDRPIGPKAPVSQESTSVHHCRQCGQGVCNGCSQTRRPVKSRGWDTPVRVCDDCLMLPEID